MERKREMYFYLNVAAHLNDLLNLFARQPMLPLLAIILKEKINQKKQQNSKSPRYKRIVWKAILSFCYKWHGFKKCVFFSNPPRCFAYPERTIRKHDNSVAFHHLIFSIQSTRYFWTSYCWRDAHFKLKHSEPSQNIFSASQKDFS